MFPSKRGPVGFTRVDSAPRLSLEVAEAPRSGHTSCCPGEAWRAGQDTAGRCAWQLHALATWAGEGPGAPVAALAAVPWPTPPSVPLAPQRPGRVPAGFSLTRHDL